MRRVLAALVALATACAANGAVPGKAAVAAQAKLAMQRTAARGLAIAVIERGRVHSVQAFGFRNKAEPLRTDTVMYGASLTKALFATLVMQLASERKIDLDRPLASYLHGDLPAYGNLDAYGHWGDLAGDERWKRITARHALTHSTGFANFAFVEPDHKLKIHFDPGTRYAYSGEGIMLLQFALEEGLGLDVEAELERRIFQPLGMTRTSLKWRDDFRPNLADGWTSDGELVAHDERSRVRAAGSMDTTIADMARFVAAFASGRLLSREAQKQMLSPALRIRTRQQFPTLLPDAGPKEQITSLAAGLGVLTFEGPQGSGWYKGGHDDSTANTLVCVNRRERCVLIMSNDVRAEAAFPALVRAVLGETGVPYRWEYPNLSSW